MNVTDGRWLCQHNARKGFLISLRFFKISLNVWFMQKFFNDNSWNSMAGHWAHIKNFK